MIRLVYWGKGGVSAPFHFPAHRGTVRNEVTRGNAVYDGLKQKHVIRLA